MTGQLRETVPATGAARRADYGAVHLGRRDIDGLILCAEHYGAPYDLLAAALGAQPARLRGITARWRRAGYAATGRLGPGPAWCWLTPAGMTAAGLGYPATRPALARLAHIRAVLAARLWLARPARPGRGQAVVALRAAPPRRSPLGVGVGHVPDAEIHWPSLAASPYPGQVWAVEVELTPKPLARTTRIMAGLLAPARYAQVIYLTAPRRPARGDPVRGAIPAGQRGQGRDPGPAVVRVQPGGPRHDRRGPGSGSPCACGCSARQSRRPGGCSLFAAGRRAVAGHRRDGRRVRRRVAARLAAGPAAPRRRRVPADDRRLAARPARCAARPGRPPRWPRRGTGRTAGHLAAAGAGPAFLLLAPAAVPAGLALAAVLWAWRIYAITTGIGGRMASAPVTFDARQWRRQVRAAQGRTAAPGNVPLLARGGRIPVGGTIRAVGAPLAAGLHPPRHRVRPAHGDHRLDRVAGRRT